MDYKKEMTKILSDLKKKNHSRRRIEKYFGYADKSLDQILSKGGNETVLNKLKEYKKQVDAGNIPILDNNEDVKNHLRKTKSQNVDRALIDMLIVEMAKVKSKLYGISVEDAIFELEQNARLSLRQTEEGL